MKKTILLALCFLCPLSAEALFYLPASALSRSLSAAPLRAECFELNPAMTAETERPCLSLSGEMLKDIYGTAAMSVILPYPRGGIAAGASGQFYRGSGAFDGSGSYREDAKVRRGSFFISPAFRLGNYFNLGAGLKYMYTMLDVYQASTLSLDTGMMFLYRDIALSLSAGDIFASFRFDSTLERLPVDFDLGLTWQADPLFLRQGSLEFDLYSGARLDTAGEFSLLWSGSISTFFLPRQLKFSLSGSLVLSVSDFTGAAWRLGGSVEFPAFAVDYALLPFIHERVVHTMGLRWYMGD